MRLHNSFIRQPFNNTNSNSTIRLLKNKIGVKNQHSSFPGTQSSRDNHEQTHRRSNVDRSATICQATEKHPKHTQSVVIRLQIRRKKPIHSTPSKIEC